MQAPCHETRYGWPRGSSLRLRGRPTGNDAMRRSGLLASVCMLMALTVGGRMASAEPARMVHIALGHSTAPLNGPWQFQVGDDPHWSSPDFDDRSWEAVDLTPAPGAHDGDVGLPGYVSGWSRRGHA